MKVRYSHNYHHHHHHLSFNHEGRWGTTDNFTTSFLHFALFSTALWDFANSRPVHSLMVSSSLFLLSAVSSSTFHSVLQDRFWPDLMNGRRVLRDASWSLHICTQIIYTGKYGPLKSVEGPRQSEKSWAQLWTWTEWGESAARLPRGVKSGHGRGGGEWLTEWKLVNGA